MPTSGDTQPLAHVAMAGCLKFQLAQIVDYVPLDHEQDDQMCGFAGFVSVRHGGNPYPLLRDMAALITHRGPDDHGYYAEGAIGFAFRRLAILDLSPAGHQPMQSTDGMHTIVFNGEIYNYIELRSTLQQLGHCFASSGDTAVLLAAYRQWGKGMLERLNGMFAFVIHDKQSGVVFGARDRFGVKPLFHHANQDGHFFGSEIKVFRAIGSLAHDHHQLALLAALGRADLIPSSPRTFVQDVHEIQAGHAFEIRMDGEFKLWKWWNLDAAVRDIKVPDDAATGFGELFESAVALRMRADVPVGVMLSGGLDSTSVICAMTALRTGAGGHQAPLHAFSYQDPAFDERRYIQDTLAQTGAMLHEPPVKDTVSMIDDLDRLLWIHDEPVHSPSALIGYWLYQAATQEGVKVVLGGQGADEILGGYSSYYAVFLRELLLRGRLGTLRRETAAIRGLGYSVPGIGQLLRMSCANGLRNIQPVHRLLARRRVQLPVWATRTAMHEGLARERLHAPEAFTLEGALRLGLVSAPLPLYLRIEDRNAMAHGIESRLPFMDFRIVSYAFKCGASAKINAGRTKMLLREWARDRIPRSVSQRSDKMGFPVAAGTWLNTALFEPIMDLLASEATRSRGLYDVPALQRLLAGKRELTETEAGAVFQFLQIEKWLCSLGGDTRRI